MQENMYAKTCKKCKQFKNRKMVYGYLTTKNIIELELWDLVHGGLLGTYDKSTIKHQTCGATTKKDVSLTCMTMTETATNWFEIVKIPNFDP